MWQPVVVIYERSGPIVPLHRSRTSTVLGRVVHAMFATAVHGRATERQIPRHRNHPTSREMANAWCAQSWSDFTLVAS